VSLGGARRSVYGRTLTAAREALDDLVGRYRKGLLGRDPRAERGTLAAWLRAWLAGKRGAVEPSTWVAYRICVEGRLVPILGRLTLRQLQAPEAAATVRRAYATLGRAPYALAPRSVHKTHSVLHQALRQAVADGLLSRNVCEAVSPPKAPRTQARALAPDEVRRLLAAAPAGRRALWTVAVFTGCRAGELLGLCWKDVALEGPRPALTVRRVLADTAAADANRQEPGGPVLRDYPKNGSSFREIPLAPEAVEALRGHRTRQTEARLAAPASGVGMWAGAGGRHGGLVFASARGSPRLTTNVRRELLADAKAAGVVFPPGSAIHCLRHSFGSALLAAGRPITEVSHLMGHSSSATTLRIYGHYIPSDKRVAAEALARYYKTG
jgi:integrase